MFRSASGTEVKTPKPMAMQITKEPSNYANTSQATGGQSNKDLMDFDDDDDFEAFKSAPANHQKLDIPSPDVEKRFSSNTGSTPQSHNNHQQGGSISWDFPSTPQNSDPFGNSQNTQKTKPSSFGFINPNNQSQSQQQQQQQQHRQQHQQQQKPQQNSNQAQHNSGVDSSKLYDLYKSPQTNQTVFIQQNNPSQNYQGGQSNYAFLEMMGNSQSQQKNQNGGFQQKQNQANGLPSNQGGMNGYGNQGGYGNTNQGGFGGNSFGGGFQNTKGNSNFGGYSQNTQQGFGGGFNGGNNNSGGFNYNTNNNNGFSNGLSNGSQYQQGFGGGSGFNGSNNSGSNFPMGQQQQNNKSNGGMNFF